MAQINLLKQAVPEVNLWTSLPKIFAKVFLGVFILLVVYYGWLVMDSKQVAKKIIAVQVQIVDAKKEGLNMPHREEVLVRQQQLLAASQVVANHLYCTGLLPELAKVTYNKARYKSIRVGTDGLLTMTGTVPTLEDLDKYLQVFDLPAFNQHFSNIRIGGYTKIQSKDNNSNVDFDLLMNYDPGLIQYKPSDK